MNSLIAKKLASPELRFSTFQEPWRFHRLGEIGILKNGLNKDKSDFGFGFPFINLMDVFGQTIYEPKPLSLVNASPKDLGSYNLQAGDVLFIRSSVKREGVAEAILIPQTLPQTVFSGFLIRFRQTKSILATSFKRYVFGTTAFRKQVLAYATTSANTNINQESLAEAGVYMPAIVEQEKIANFLTAVDQRIQQLIEKKALLEDYKKGVMQQLFTQAIRFKDDHGNDFPDWEEKKLGEVASVIGGGTPDSKNEAYWNGNVQWFTPTEIRTKYTSRSRRNISDLGLKKCSATLLPIGTILFTSRATIAEVSIATEQCTTNQGFQSIKVNPDTSNEFIYYWVIQFRKDFLRKSQGSTFREIGGKEVRKMSIFIPNFPEQTKIANFLAAIDQKIETVASQITETQTFKRGLLQQMFV